jgi:hypothetical protein
MAKMEKYIVYKPLKNGTLSQKRIVFGRTRKSAEKNVNNMVQNGRLPNGLYFLISKKQILTSMALFRKGEKIKKKASRTLSKI